MEINPKSYSFMKEADIEKIDGIDLLRIIKQSNVFGEKTAATIILSVEQEIHQLIKGIAERDIDGIKTKLGIDITEKELIKLPSSITGVILYYLIDGLERDYNIIFENKPKSIKTRFRALSGIKGRKRFYSLEQKNDLWNRTKISFYDEEISNNVLNLPDVLDKIKVAYEEIKNLEKVGLILPEKKNDYPQYIGVDYITKQEDKTKETIMEEEDIIAEINMKIIGLMEEGLVTLPKQTRGRTNMKKAETT